MADLVPESEQQYGSILTVLGESAEQNGKMLKKPVEFTHIAFGDANDTYVQPDRKAQSLVNELYRIPVNSVDVLQPTPDSVPILKVEALIPDDIHDIVIREFAAVATFNGQSYFHAVGNCARVYVPNPVNNGQLNNPVSLEMTFVITSAEPIVEMDPNVITASRNYVNTQVSKSDERVAQALIDQNGKDWFIEDGFQVLPKTDTSVAITPGAGYVSGNRVSLGFERIISVPAKPAYIYLDAKREGTPTGEQIITFNFVVSAEEKDDYIDTSTGKQIPHFVCKIAQVLEDGSVSDLRPEGESASRVYVEDETKYNSQAQTSAKQIRKDKSALQGTVINGEKAIYLKNTSRNNDDLLHIIGNIPDGEEIESLDEQTLKLKSGYASKAIKSSPYKVINIEDYGCKGDYYLYKLNPIAKYVGSVFDAIVNPTPTDNAPIINKLFSEIDSNIPVRIKAGVGDFYCSVTLGLDYQVNNFWRYTKGIGRAYFRGEGIGSTAFIFPESIDSGLEVNKSFGITNVNIGSFTLKRLGFDPHIYQARPTGDEDFDFSDEPRFGCGLYVNHNGYIGDVSDIYIDGFYCSFKNERAYNAKASRIFNTKNAIYGYIGDNNTTVRQSDCNFKGYQAGWVSRGGSNTLSNIVVEGVMGAMESDPSLMDKFRGHGFWQLGGRCTMLGGCYTEKLTGYARAMVGTTYHEIGGICSNSLNWHYNNDMSQDLKDKVDIYNPDLICIYIVSNVERTISKLESSYLRVADAIYVNDKSIARDKAHTNIFEIINTLPTDQGFKNTLDNVFKKHRPVVLSLPSAFDNAQPVKYDAPTIFRGTCKSLFEYTSNYNGYARFGFGRIMNEDSWYERAEMLWGMDADGNAYASLSNYDDLDQITSSTLCLKHYKSGALGVGGSIIPISNGGGDCGQPEKKFEDAYFVNSPIIGSDVRIKNNINSIPQELLDFALNVEIKQYKLCDGSSGRNHYGIIIDDSLLNGLRSVINLDECAAFCHSVFLDEHNEPIELDVGGVQLGDMWQVRYTEWQNILLEAFRRKLLPC